MIDKSRGESPAICEFCFYIPARYGRASSERGCGRNLIVLVNASDSRASALPRKYQLSSQKILRDGRWCNECVQCPQFLPHRQSVTRDRRWCHLASSHDTH